MEPYVFAELESTPDEGWTHRATSPWHHYTAAATFALDTLGPGRDRRCLVIGSAPFEVQALRRAGWDVVYLDVRHPPHIVRDLVIGDACRLPFRSDTFDAVSTTCVLCHVGLGRYGDVIERNGDDIMLSEISRVMKPRAMSAMMFGPARPRLIASYAVGRIHRVYAPSEAIRQVTSAGLKPRSFGLWFAGKWMSETEMVARAEADRMSLEILNDAGIAILEYTYLAMLAEKQ